MTIQDSIDTMNKIMKKYGLQAPLPAELNEPAFAKLASAFVWFDYNMEQKAQLIAVLNSQVADWKQKCVDLNMQKSVFGVIK